MFKKVFFSLISFLSFFSSVAVCMDEEGINPSGKKLTVSKQNDRDREEKNFSSNVHIFPKVSLPKFPFRFIQLDVYSNTLPLQILPALAGRCFRDEEWTQIVSAMSATQVERAYTSYEKIRTGLCIFWLYTSDAKIRTEIKAFLTT